MAINNTVKMSASELIVAIQLEYKISQGEIARAVGVRDKTVNFWVKGKAKPHNTFRKALLKILREGVGE